jgi:hypothetical protein
VKGTTARIEAAVKARIGSSVMHAMHGKVTLIGQPMPGKLEIELTTVTTRKIVDAVECYDPVGTVRTRDQSVYFAEAYKVIAVERTRLYISIGISAFCGLSEPKCDATVKGKAKARRTGKAKMVEDPTAPKNKGGRPKGSKDSVPRQPRADSGKVAWVYEGENSPKGRQVARIGATVEHVGISRAILLDQVGLEHLQLRAETEGNEYAIIVDSAQCFAVENLEAIPEGGTLGAGSSPKRRKTGGRKRKELTQDDQVRGLSPLSTKADVVSIQKRRKREEAALAHGRPLKPQRTKKNRKWDPAIKEQAVSFYSSCHSVGADYEACTKQLLSLPGYVGLTRGLLRAWVQLHASRAVQEPNEYGLIVTMAGRQPNLPAEFYEELKAVVKGLAQTRAIRVCVSSMQPIIRTLIVHRLGAQVIRPGMGGFIVGSYFLRQLARDTELRWRKPYGDARKPPADADAQISDMVLRLAYLMKEHSIPRALVLNFDHTGLHFMQQRGNTYTEVKEDKHAAHKSRNGKQKEVKLKGLNDKRQATGTVGSSLAGDVLPGQLLVEGVSTSHKALPDLPGCTYAKLRGSNPGHDVGWRLVQHGVQADAGLRERTWLGHLSQTTNHWANIQTSYGILEYIIIPWLLEKKASMDLPADNAAVLIVDCWYGWKDQDKMKTLQNFRDYVSQRYPWLRLLFVPAACTDLAQPADRGMVSWLKANMRQMFNDVISADVMKQLEAGTVPEAVTLDVSAPHLEQLLALAFAKALSELPRETVIHCWAPLQAAYDNMDALHAKAAQDLLRLFPNMRTHVPTNTEEEPTSDADDDFEQPAPRAAQMLRQHTVQVHAEHTRAADIAVANGAAEKGPIMCSPLLQMLQ